jgi:uncharacterized protein YcbK (DUF882 family)
LLTAGGLAAGASVAGILARPARGAGLFVANQFGVDEPDVHYRPAVVEERMIAKRLALRNLHTPESLDLEFFRGDAYVPEALAAIQILLRDFRNDEQHAIDPPLLDTLYDVARNLGVDPVFSVISGYRSPQTNEQLRERGSGVARHSLHLEGRAIDVRLAGVDCADLAAGALSYRRGGVGYYRRSDFVHLDTGAFRTWRG